MALLNQNYSLVTAHLQMDHRCHPPVPQFYGSLERFEHESGKGYKSNTHLPSQLGCSGVFAKSLKGGRFELRDDTLVLEVLELASRLVPARQSGAAVQVKLRSSLLILACQMMAILKLLPRKLSTQNENLADNEGFEPSKGYPLHAFQACALGHYANSPVLGLSASGS